MNLSKAEYAKKAVSVLRGCERAFVSPTFNEFVLEIGGDPEKVLKRLRGRRSWAEYPWVLFTRSWIATFSSR